MSKTTKQITPHVADELRSSSLRRLVRELRAWCKKESAVARRDGQGRGFTDSNRARAFGRMDAMAWVVDEIDRRLAKLPNDSSSATGGRGA